MAELGTLVKLFASRSQGEIRRGKTSFLVGGSGNGDETMGKFDGGWYVTGTGGIG